MAVDYIELFDLQQQLREGLEDLFPEKLWIRAEIASVQVKSNGHCYLDLCQSVDNAVVAKAKAVIWRSRYSALARYFSDTTGSDLKPGITILVRVQLSYSELYGLSLVIDELEPQYTLGEAELLRRKTIDKLTEEGLIDAQKELALPDLPYALAVISAATAAGFGDFCRHVSENEYGFVFRVDLFEATMQGVGAPGSIVDALDSIQTGAVRYDAVLILRGGGSALDLACFDDYSLCAAIANCSIPVFTAIGHDRDFHVADMVAHTYVKTPTALADEFLECYMAEDERLSSFATRLKLAYSSKLSLMEAALATLETRIKSADPRSILSRGYSLVTTDEGVVVKKASDVQKGDKIKILFADGCFTAEVREKY